MRCCVNCFRDLEIKAVIDGQNINGDCDFCKTRNVNVYDFDKNATIKEYFDGLLDVYTPVSSLPTTFPNEQLDLLQNILYKKWNIFNLTLAPENIYTLLKNICQEKYQERPEVFDEPVGILEITQPDYLKANSILRTFQWDDFIEEIKCKNRFHTSYINTDVLKLFLEKVRKPYKQGTVFYRARISTDAKGFGPEKMGAPPASHATSGRANSEGISCLYLGNSERTTLHEIRAGVYDYVTIGSFELLKDIEVVNLASIDTISPFSGIDNSLLAINIENLQRIGYEIAKPLRRHDSILDYLPTQYISDYIKSQKFDGIEYKSTMCPDGYNLAIFDESSFRCTKVTVHDIRSLTYSCEPNIT